MQCRLEVGQKVVCIQECWRWHTMDIRTWGFTVPVVGKVYTIREVVLNATTDGGCIPCLRLVEIVNPPLPSPPCHEGNREPAFAHFAFKPLEEKKTDISVFQKMLLPTKITERVS